MKYLIYKITNCVNGKIYIGCHQTKDIDDNYMGSSKLLEQAIKKYSAESFKKEILHIFNNRDEMLDKEKELVDNKFVKRSDTYNLREGGMGGDTFTHNPNKELIRAKISKKSKRLRHTEETKRKMSIAAKNRPPMPQEAIDRAEAKRNIKRKSGNYFSPEGIEKLRLLGKEKVFTKEYRKKLSENAKQRPKVTCPFCNKIGQKNAMMRWHFDNCKEK